ncbi:hypothetical protein [Streptomyces finlayi]|uniref:hypothetical protein n=1 Tax=Streptomyces finlayi TaxID=67296 RepID=UPI0016234A55|nr:hypothetical protein [Streptomyces finlayi]
MSGVPGLSGAPEWPGTLRRGSGGHHPRYVSPFADLSERELTALRGLLGKPGTSPEDFSCGA